MKKSVNFALQLVDRQPVALYVIIAEWQPEQR